MAELTEVDIEGLAMKGKYIARVGGNPGHFVTVESVENGIVNYWDPDGGKNITKSVKKFTEIATGVVFK